MEPEEFKPRTDIQPLSEITEKIQAAIGEVIVGQHEMIEMLLAGLLADGHLLIEGVPGVAKTLTARLLSRLIDIKFSRIQFTPDLMPSDVLGTNIFHSGAAEFRFRPGPIFSNLVLIDEVNRAPAKTQAALFEVMEEKQVTLDGITHTMQPPFMVVATQNPIEHEGTYRLPEAQLDRFLMKIMAGYPAPAEEVTILERQNRRSIPDQLANASPVLKAEDLQFARARCREVHISPELMRYIVEIVQATRSHGSLYVGGSPRASIAMMQVAKAIAVLRERDFVTPEDVRHVALPVLRHRVSLMADREMDGATADEVLQEILKNIEVPR